MLGCTINYVNQNLCNVSYKKAREAKAQKLEAKKNDAKLQFLKYSAKISNQSINRQIIKKISNNTFLYDTLHKF